MNTNFFDEKKFFHLFYSVIELINILSIVIQNKKYLLVFYLHKIKCLLLDQLCYIWFIFFFLYAKLNTCK